MNVNGITNNVTVNGNYDGNVANENTLVIQSNIYLILTAGFSAEHFRQLTDLLAAGGPAEMNFYKLKPADNNSVN